MLSNFAALGALYVALSPRVAMPLYGGMLFHPDKYPGGNYNVESVNEVKLQEIFFPSAKGKKLHAWFFRNPWAKRTIIFNHGNAGNLTYRLGMVRLMLAGGASVFLFDYQGYGLSEGAPTLSGICHDGIAAYDYLVGQEGVAADDVILYGESLGAGVSCQVASERAVSGLILQSAFLSLQRISREVMPFIRIYPQWLFPRQGLDNLAYLKREHPPLLLLHGRLDAVVPFSHGQELYTLAAEPKILVPLPQAGHNDIAGTEPELFSQAFSQFLAKLP